MLIPIDSRPPIVNADIQFVHEFWAKKRSARGQIPSLVEIDPVEILDHRLSALQHLWLLDVVRPELRFRYRLIGEELGHAQIKARVGQFIDEFEVASAPDSLHSQLCALLDGSSLSHRIGSPRLPHSPYIKAIERLSLPLSSDGKLIDVILNATAFEWSADFADIFESLATR